MMALSGVRSSWLMLARNCDLCWLASASCWLLSWISSNSRTFSIAITAWSAKVVTSSICLSVNGRTSERTIDMTPMGVPSRSNGTPSMVRKPPSFMRFGPGVFRIGQHIGNMDRLAFEQRYARSAYRVPACNRIVAHQLP